MDDPINQSDYLTLPLDVLRHSKVANVPVPTLTILYHPDVNRIGQFAILSQLDRGQCMGLSRNTLEFYAYRGSDGETLNDPYLSRKPLTLGFSSGQYLVAPAERGSPVEMLGVPFTGDAYRIEPDALDNGVVMVLAERVVLLLHMSKAGFSQADRQGCNLVGCCDEIIDVRRAIAQCAEIEADVLLLGESGTGKEIVAQAIHQKSTRSQSRLVNVNMSAIPVSLAASELFGHTKGAYTGADGDKLGYFRQAEGGTLFLDEIGDTPVEIQPQLLRVLEAREVQPVGGAPHKVNVRLISASDIDLDEAVKEADFRNALRHRLGAYEIHLPPLRERQGDIARLLLHF